MTARRDASAAEVPQRPRSWALEADVALAAAAGALGPVAFVAAVVAGSLLQDDYSWRHEFISGLSAGTARYRWVMVAGFVVAGVSALPLAWSLHRAIRPGPGGIAGPLLVAGGGVCLALMGPFANDCSDALAACKAQLAEGKSWQSAAHDLVNIPAFFCLVVGPLVLAARMLPDDRWRGLGRLTLAWFPVVAAIMLADGLEVTDRWGGLVQRAHVLMVVTWTELVAGRVVWLARRAD